MSTVFDELRLRSLRHLFDDADAALVDRWFRTLHKKRPVVLVGAGFSRNATGGARLPLWGDIGKRLADIAGVPVDGDLITLAEYAWNADASACARTLLQSLPDDQISPGKAHRALFDHDVEAVITTNNLDTLLDRSGAWHSVVRDSDLPLNADRRPPLIYFHGHRSAPDTWVFTRSQYEDLPGSRPAMYSKVRQLLAESPVLCVGFGLSDPNFHSVYRNIAKELDGFQDRGLALMVEPVPSAVRNTWNALGLELVQIREGGVDPATRSFDDLFAAFFALHAGSDAPKTFIRASPAPLPTDAGFRGSKPATSRSEPSEFQQVVAVLRDEPSMSRRLEFWAQYIRAPGRELGATQRTELWKCCLAHELGPVQFASADWTPGVTTLLSSLPRRRFNPSFRDPVIRTVDGLLERGDLDVSRPDTLESLVDWLLVRVGEHADDFLSYDTRPTEAIGLAAYLLGRAGQLAKGDPRLQQRLQQKLQTCHRASVQFDAAPDVFPLDFDADFAALGRSFDPASFPSDPFVSRMEQAARALADADYPQARAHYQAAVEEAGHGEFRRWLAVEGLAQTLHRDRTVPRDDAVFSDVRRQVKGARSKGDVAQWLDRARRQRETLREDTIRNLTQDAEAYASQGPVWRNFRRLEAEGAPDHLSRRELEPLLAADSTIDDQAALHYRISLCTRTQDARAWLRRLANEGGHSNTSNVDGTALVDVGLRQYSTRWSRDRQLELLEDLIPWANKGHEPRLQEILLEHLRLHASGDYRGIELTGAGHLTRCWAACDRYLAVASLGNLETLAVAYLDRALQTGVLSDRTDIDDWAWERWTLEDPSQAFALWSRLADMAEDAPLVSVQASLTYALSVVARNATGPVRGAIEDRMRTRLKSVATTMAEDPSADTWSRTAALLLRWTSADVSTRGQLLRAHEAELVADIARAKALEPGARCNALGSVATMMHNAGLLGAEPLEAARHWLDAWTAVADPAHAWRDAPPFGLGFVLGCAVLSSDTRVSSRAAESFLEALPHNTFVLGGLPRACTDAAVWGSHWRPLMQALQAAATGSPHRDAQDRRLGVLRGLTELHRNRGGPSDVPDPAFLDRIREVPILFAGSPDVDVARAAVQALGFMAQTARDADVDRVGDVFELASKDVRPKVRAPAAYATTRVHRFGSAALRSRVAHLRAQSGASGNLGVYHSHCLAELEAEYARPHDDP